MFMGINGFLRVVGSLRFAAVILVLFCIAMACATVYEAAHGTPAALAVFYKSWWFQTLLGLLGLNVLASMLARYPWSRRQAGFLITHGSILVILVGALVTEMWAINGRLSVVEGTSVGDFRIDQDVLTLRRSGDSATTSVDLSGGVGGFKPVTGPHTDALVSGEIRATVEEYLPDTRRTENVVDDNPQPSLAVEIVLTSDGQTSRTWVFENDPRATLITVRSAATSAEMNEFKAGPASQPAGDRLVHLKIDGDSYELPLENCLEGPVPVGQTGYAIEVLRYLPHALVGDDKRLVSASDRSVNPAIEAEVTTPSGQTLERFAFARFPEFSSMHGSHVPAAEVELTLVAPFDEQTTTPIELVAGPEGRLAVRFTPQGAEAVTRDLALGETVETPWPGMSLTVECRFENARRDSAVEPVLPPRRERNPAIAVRLEGKDTVRHVWLRKYEPQQVELAGERYELAFDDKRLSLGFELKLNKFHLGTYPGSHQPRTFESHVTLVSPYGAEENRIISMNHPAKFGGYSLFQSSYEQRRSGPNVSVLSVSWDPGLYIVFAGYVTLVAGMLYVLGTRMRARRSASERDNEPAENPSQAVSPELQPAPGTAPPDPMSPSPPAACPSAVRRTLSIGLVALLAWHTAPAIATPGTSLPNTIDLNVVRGIAVQHDGRWMPLDTLARDMVKSVTGTRTYRDQDPVNWLLAWTFDAHSWMHEPLIPIGSAELRRELRLPAERTEFSYAELLQHQPLLDQIEHLSHRGRGKMNPLESKVSDINGRLIQLQEVFGNQVIKPVPDATSAMAAWRPIPFNLDSDDSASALERAWTDLGGAFLADDGPAFSAAAQAVSAELAGLPSAHTPSPARLATELRYNRLEPYTLAWKLMIGGAALSALALAVQRRWFDAIAVVVMLAGFGVLTYGLAMRWQIAGRIPAANMFESLLFLSWGAGAFAIVAMLFLKDRSVPLTASAIGALALFLADVTGLDSFVRPIPPVLLDTVWMSLHVPVIMVSYAVLAVAALIAHVQMFSMAVVPHRRQFLQRIDGMHYWYLHVGVILLGVGIVTGSMWAAFSWGRYWGWDPKEVWSLIAFVAYLVIMHVRVDRERIPFWTYALAAALGAALFAIVVPKFVPLTSWPGPGELATLLILAAAAVVGVLFVTVRGQFASAFKSIVAFWAVIMTYLGVNYVLGIGLHSYGFGTGAVVHHLLLVGSIDLLLIGLLTSIYLFRTRESDKAMAPVSLVG